MASSRFRVGTLVKNKEDGKLGAVVNDLFHCCGPNQVPVEWDGTIGIRGVDWNNLEEENLIIPKINSEKCRTCIYSNGNECLRYGPGGPCMLYRDGKAGMRIPDRIYPHCQTSETSLEIKKL